ncbi:MAG: MG2 domain-containing protein, partial [Pseudomonadota bacterium]
MASSTTDPDGSVRFPQGLTQGTGGMAPALLVARNGETDYVFLNLATSAFDLTDRGVAGRAPAGPLEAFMFTERGVYRPGGVVHVTALLRDQRANAVHDVPTTLVIYRPDGKEHRRVILQDQGLGARLHDLQLSTSAMTGTWRARLFTDPKSDPVGSASFLVEDFVPERLSLALTPDATSVSPSASTNIALTGRYLYGPPAADLTVEGDVTVRLRSQGRPGWKGYTFGLDDEAVAPVRANLAELPRTDKTGRATLPLTLPALPRTARPLEARVNVRLREAGGRTIERRAVLPVATATDAIGIKPTFKAGELSPESEARFHVAHVSADGTSRDGSDLVWTLFRLERTYQWYNRNGDWRYESVDFTRKATSGTVTTTNESGARPGAKISIPVDWGRYRLEVAAADDRQTVSSFAFNAGWFGTADADTPERLEVALDRKGYKPGDTARLTISSDDAGLARVTVLGNGVHLSKEVRVTPGETTVDLEVADDWAPGAYVTTFFYRPMDIGNKRMPRRAIGVQWLDIDRTHRTIAVTTNAPKQIRSGSTLEVPVRLAGLRKGEKAHLVMAAVDVGILNLTKHKTPSPDDWFYAQRRLGVEVRDLYGRLIDGMRANRGALRSGGDGGGAGTSGSPPTGDPVALFSGLVTAEADGTAVVRFDIPEFNGTLRVMTAVWTGARLGHAEQDVIVRDPIVMQVASPRFLTMGDESRLLLDIHNVDAPAGDVTLAVTRQIDSEEPSDILRETLSFAKKQRRYRGVPIIATAPGETTYTVSLKGPGAVSVRRTLTFRVNPPGPAVNRRTVAKLAPGQ